MERQQEQLLNPIASASSSPSQEFSFTISLHSSATAAKILDKNKHTTPTPPPPFAIDLSPADEIFFHGHLLPLHVLSPLPVSPRCSTNSLDGLRLPTKELPGDNSTTSTTTADHYNIKMHDRESSLPEGKGRDRFKSLSLFGLQRWRKWFERREKDHHERQKRKSKFDMSHLLQTYARMVRPFLSLSKRTRDNHQIQRQPCSFAENFQVRSNKNLRGRRGEYSAPASMRTSPPDSGLLVASGSHTSTRNDSTMEELQAAIQAAIAHCKESIAAEDKHQAAMTI